VNFLVGLSGCAFILGLALYPTPHERLHGATRLWGLMLFLLSALSLIGAALCT
jgi:hypothetical protein